MWRNAQVGHAAVNNVFVAAVDRVWKRAITFWGGSFVASPAGSVMVKGDHHEAILYADRDRARVPALQGAWRFLANRRPETYRTLVD
jgi:N-carbamoylputrescine amidase